MYQCTPVAAMKLEVQELRSSMLTLIRMLESYPAVNTSELHILCLNCEVVLSLLPLCVQLSCWLARLFRTE